MPGKTEIFVSSGVLKNVNFSVSDNFCCFVQQDSRFSQNFLHLTQSDDDLPNMQLFDILLVVFF